MKQHPAVSLLPLLFAGLVMLGPGTALAQLPENEAAAPTPDEMPAPEGETTDATPTVATDAASTSDGGGAEVSLSHAGQLGLAVIFGGGALLRVVYDVDENPCNEEDADNPVCTGGAPLFLDVELSYALSDGVELALPLRVALTEDQGEKPMLIIPMARLWPLDPSMFNLFFEVGVPIMMAPRTDVGAHLGVGLQIDFNRMLGLRLGAFPDAFFADELITTFNFGIGLQGRFLNW